MPENLGVAPPDYETPTGQIRAILGDTHYEETDTPGIGSYQYFSDAEIEAFLVASDGGIEGAVAFAYNSMATSAALEARTVKDFDLQVSTEKRATELRLLARQWRDKADALSADIFEVFDTVEPEECHAELSAYRVCRRGGYAGIF